MPDLDHTFGEDLVLGDGTAAMATGSALTTQRLLRRLCTNPGAYLWDLSYGAGLPGKVGSPVLVSDITAIIATQMAMEDGVASTPAAQITVTSDPAGGFLYATIVYWATSGGDPITLQVPENTVDG